MVKIIKKVVNSQYEDINPNKENNRIYKIHKYWARKPWYIVEKYIQKYSCQGELVMDPFCGSGCTGLEAIINGRNFLGQDLNPISVKIAKGTLKYPVNLMDLQEDFNCISKKVKDKILHLYLSEERCESCGDYKYYKYLNIGPKFANNEHGMVVCLKCKNKPSAHILSQKEKKAISIQNKYGNVPSYPDAKFPEKFYKDRFSYKGIKKVSDMFTERNIYALALLYQAIETTNLKYPDLLLLAFTNTLLHVSKLKSENVRPLSVNNYWVPDDYCEDNVWLRFEDRFNNLFLAKKQQDLRVRAKDCQYGKYRVDLKSALKVMEKESVDYFFTDPPYGDAIQYSELSYIWNVWSKEVYSTAEEVIINPVQNKDADLFNDLLGKSLNNIYFALKSERYFTLCFQNKNVEVWEKTITHCRNLGFQLVDVSVYNTYQSPFNKGWAKFSPKSDIYVTFKKTNVPQKQIYNKKESIEEIIGGIVEFCGQNGVSLNNNRIYDYTVSYLIWSMFLNKQKIDVKNFDVKTFVEIARDIC